MKEIAEKDQKKSFALMFIDLDNFKGYNDTLHDVGDLKSKRRWLESSGKSVGK